MPQRGSSVSISTRAGARAIRCDAPAREAAERSTCRSSELHIDVVADTQRPAYGVPHAATVERSGLPQAGALPVDPVYSGRGLPIDCSLREGRWSADDDVIFIHTGGSPALFAYQALWDNLAAHGMRRGQRTSLGHEILRLRQATPIECANNEKGRPTIRAALLANAACRIDH